MTPAFQPPGDSPLPSVSMTIGSFARATGLSPNALRLYDDSGLLVPAWVDPGSGYRYYLPGQVTAARRDGLLCRAGMPLATLAGFLATLPAEPKETEVDPGVEPAGSTGGESTRAAVALLTRWWQEQEEEDDARRGPGPRGHPARRAGPLGGVDLAACGTAPLSADPARV